MIPNTETIFVIIPSGQILTRHVNLSVHRTRDDVQELEDGRLLLEVPVANTADFLDFVWLDNEGARTLIEEVGLKTPSTSWWSNLFS